MSAYRKKKNSELKKSYLDDYLMLLSLWWTYFTLTCMKKKDMGFRGSRRKSIYILILTLYWMCNVFGLMSSDTINLSVCVFDDGVSQKNDCYLGNCLIFLNQSLWQFDFFPSSGINIPAQVGLSARACLSHWKFTSLIYTLICIIIQANFKIKLCTLW